MAGLAAWEFTDLLGRLAPAVQKVIGSLSTLVRGHPRSPLLWGVPGADTAPESVAALHSQCGCCSAVDSGNNGLELIRTEGRIDPFEWAAASSSTPSEISA
jgi:hypothetical protein